MNYIHKHFHDDAQDVTFTTVLIDNQLDSWHFSHFKITSLIYAQEK